MGQMNPLGNESLKITYDKTGSNGNGSKAFDVENASSVLHSNRIFGRTEIDAYEKFSRFGYLNPYQTETVSREFLFFTKPDLYLFDCTTYANANADKLVEELAYNPFFIDCATRYKRSMLQLQHSVKDSKGKKTPFMYLLSNRVTSKLELPGLSAESQDSTANLFSTNITYRTHSLKSDLGYDFTLSFSDSNTLDLYYLVKIYDEYMRLYRTGEVSPKQEYILNHVLPEQFSVYKFLIGEDGETILYYAKMTGVYFTDVPRSDFGDPEAPFKFSLGFHAQFVEDNNPVILSEFNAVAGVNADYTSYTNTFNGKTGFVNNEFVKYPVIVSATDDRAAHKPTGKDYRLLWKYEG